MNPLPVRCAVCGCHSAEGDLCRRSPLGYVCADAVACARRQLARAIRHQDEEENLVARARGMAQVDRAVKGYRSPRTGPVSFHAPPIRRAS